MSAIKIHANLLKRPSHVLAVGDTVVFGDMHGNALALIWKWLATGVFIFPEGAECDALYQRFVDLYQEKPKEAFFDEEKKEGKRPYAELEADWDAALLELDVNTNSKVDLDGDLTGDRGENGLLTFRVLKRLDDAAKKADQEAGEKVSKSYTINASNHGASFMFEYECFRKQIKAGKKEPNEVFKPAMINDEDFDGGFMNSSDMLLSVLFKGIEAGDTTAFEAFDPLYDSLFAEHLVLFDVSFDADENSLNVVSHAPTTIQSVFTAADLFDIDQDTQAAAEETKEGFMALIAAINEKFQEHVASGAVTEEGGLLSDASVRDFYSQYNQEKKGVPSDDPKTVIFQAIWNRYMVPGEKEKHDAKVKEMCEKMGISAINMIHGHTGPKSSPIGINLDTNLGKAGGWTNTNDEEMFAFVHTSREPGVTNRANQANEEIAETIRSQINAEDQVPVQPVAVPVIAGGGGGEKLTEEEIQQQAQQLQEQIEQQQQEEQKRQEEEPVPQEVTIDPLASVKKSFQLFASDIIDKMYRKHEIDSGQVTLLKTLSESQLDRFIGVSYNGKKLTLSSFISLEQAGEAVLNRRFRIKEAVREQNTLGFQDARSPDTKLYDVITSKYRSLQCSGKEVECDIFKKMSSILSSIRFGQLWDEEISTDRKKVLFDQVGSDLHAMLADSVSYSAETSNQFKSFHELVTRYLSEFQPQALKETELTEQKTLQVTHQLEAQTEEAAHDVTRTAVEAEVTEDAEDSSGSEEELTEEEKEQIDEQLDQLEEKLKKQMEPLQEQMVQLLEEAAGLQELMEKHKQQQEQHKQLQEEQQQQQEEQARQLRELSRRQAQQKKQLTQQALLAQPKEEEAVLQEAMIDPLASEKTACLDAVNAALETNIPNPQKTEPLTNIADYLGQEERLESEENLIAELKILVMTRHCKVDNLAFYEALGAAQTLLLKMDFECVGNSSYDGEIPVYVNKDSSTVAEDSTAAVKKDDSQAQKERKLTVTQSWVALVGLNACVGTGVVAAVLLPAAVAAAGSLLAAAPGLLALAAIAIAGFVAFAAAGSVLVARRECPRLVFSNQTDVPRFVVDKSAGSQH